MTTHRSNVRKCNYLLTFISILGANSFILKQPSFNSQCVPSVSKESKRCYSFRSCEPSPPLRNNKSSLSYSSINDDKNGGNDPRESEFSSLEPQREGNNSVRKNRQEREKFDQRRFAGYGNDLWGLRSTIDDLTRKLVDSMATGRAGDVEDVKDELRKAERRDPFLVYGMELEATEKALEEGRIKEASLHRQEAMRARSCLPQFNFDGLWIGKYGDHGFEMINVTYVGDIMIARKVTGDKNVPIGEISFQIDMSPPPSNPSLPSTRKPLANIVLSKDAAKRWGTNQISRYQGLGQVAEEGFVNHQWMDGQMVVINEEYFSFSWMPLNHQIFFGRPSAELSIKMLRESKKSERRPTVEDDLDTMKEHVTRCFDVTAAEIDDELIDGKDDAFSCIYYDEGTCSFE